MLGRNPGSLKPLGGVVSVALTASADDGGNKLSVDNAAMAGHGDGN